MGKRLPILLVVLAAVGVAVWWLRTDHGPVHYTGFVEGEERVIRSEVTGRVLEVPYREGATVPAGAIVAKLDDRDIAARVAAKRAEVDSFDAQIRKQEEQITLTGSTWQRDRSARAAEVQEAAAAAERAERTFAREQDLVRTGASTAQQLDDMRAARDQARSALQRTRELLGRADAEERNITLARQQRDVLQAAARHDRGPARRAGGDAGQVHHPVAGRADRRADAAHLARRAGAARNVDRVGARSDRQVRPGVRAGGRPGPLPRRSQGRRSSSTASPATACQAR